MGALLEITFQQERTTSHMNIDNFHSCSDLEIHNSFRQRSGQLLLKRALAAAQPAAYEKSLNTVVYVPSESILQIIAEAVDSLA